MKAVVIIGIDRPGLGGMLRQHGLATAGPPVAALVAAGIAAPLRPTLVEAGAAAMAAALLGADADDVVLASDPDLLVAARLAALVRRAAGSRPAPSRLVIGDLAIDPVERRVARAGRPIPLLPREYAVLLHLARRCGAVVSREELTHEVLGLGFDPGTNVVTVHVSRLRAKLHAEGGDPILMTERGQGYRLAA